MSTEDLMLDYLQRAAFNYFLMRINPNNGLVTDTSREGAPASIAVSGFALSSYPAAVERGWITRHEAVQRTLTTLCFFYYGPKGGTFKTIGHRGFCYHFLDMKTGKRAWDCEISFIDTALLLAGMLTAATYFTKNTEDEIKIRRLADKFYRRIEWDWAMDDSDTFPLAWKPGRGFMPQHWQHYNEGLILYIFGLASPTHPIDVKNYQAFVSTYEWKTYKGISSLYAGPLFIHHFPHAWIDFRDIQDSFMSKHGSDYFKNSCAAIRIHQLYAKENKEGFTGYNENCWGLTAGDGPSNKSITVKHKRHPALGYAARGAPYGSDDGTMSPAGLLGSLPFAPRKVISAIKYLNHHYPDVIKNYHVSGGFNPSLQGKGGGIWVSDAYYGLDQGIIMLMIENYRSGLLWKITRQNPHIRKGLKLAGFKHGWLDKIKLADA